MGGQVGERVRCVCVSVACVWGGAAGKGVAVRWELAFGTRPAPSGIYCP